MPKGLAFVLMLLVVVMALLAVTARGAWEPFWPDAYASSLQPFRSGQDDSIKRAAFGSGRLWLLTDAGDLWVVDEASRSASRVPTPHPVHDMCTQSGALIVAAAGSEAAKAWTLHRWSDGRWARLASVATAGEGLAGIACDLKRVMLLTSNRLVVVGAGETTSHALTARVPAKLVSVFSFNGDKLFVGANAGEWGGGLQAIDIRTGEVRRVDRNATGDICGGPLNTDCDPVHGLVASPWKPGCVVAAVGLIHMMAHGRLVEVCGDQIETVLSLSCPPQDGRAPAPRECTIPFFGVAEEQGRLVAIAPGEVVRLGRDHKAERVATPEPENYGPFKVSFTPTMALVYTSINQRHSLSGVTPLLVER